MRKFCRGKPRSSHDIAIPPQSLVDIQESLLSFPTPVTQAGPDGPPAKAGVHTPEVASYVFQQSITNEGCSLGPHATSAWQESNNTLQVEAVIESAGRRHQEVVQQQADMAEQHHQQAVAQLTGEAVRALGEQAQGHAHATEQLRREASNFTAMQQTTCPTNKPP